MTPIPAMQAALEALETALPLAKEEWTVRADWNTAGMAAIAKMESALCLLRGALDAGEPQPVAEVATIRMEDGKRAKVIRALSMKWIVDVADGTKLYASPVAAAPQGDAKDAARYRWLRDRGEFFAHKDGRPSPWAVIGTGYGDHLPCSGSSLDAAIDAAASPTLNEQGKAS